jgi:hypothetical protein
MLRGMPHMSEAAIRRRLKACAGFPKPKFADHHIDAIVRAADPGERIIEATVRAADSDELVRNGVMKVGLFTKDGVAAIKFALKAGRENRKAFATTIAVLERERNEGLKALAARVASLEQERKAGLDASAQAQRVDEIGAVVAEIEATIAGNKKAATRLDCKIAFFENIVGRESGRSPLYLIKGRQIADAVLIVLQGADRAAGQSCAPVGGPDSPTMLLILDLLAPICEATGEPLPDISTLYDTLRGKSKNISRPKAKKRQAVARHSSS